MNAELIKALKEDAEWAHANEWETPITLGDHLDAAADALEALQSQLSESRRREQAAVEDLKRFSACCQCNANIDGSCCDMFDGTAENKYFCSNWQWRGSQEAEEGGTNGNHAR